MAHHELKIWPQNFEEVRSGRTPFDIRQNDRRFQKGDTIAYREWDPSRPQTDPAYKPVPMGQPLPDDYKGHGGDYRYTGRRFARTISCVISGWGIQPEHVVFGLAPAVEPT